MSRCSSQARWWPRLEFQARASHTRRFVPRFWRTSWASTSVMSMGPRATHAALPPGSTWAAGCHAAYVRVDPKTFRLEILKYVVVHDCGRVINPMVLEGQIEGGVAQGIGGAFYERLAYDDEGQLRNASFMEFLMPYATEIPAIEIDHIETPSPLNPLGVKGAGEAGVIPVGAVIASAVEEALGVPITEMPLSPLKLYELVKRPS